MQNLNFPQQGNSLVRRLNETLLEDYFSLSNANVCVHLQFTEDISRGSAPAHSSCFSPRLRKIQNIQLLHKPLSRILITFPGAQPHGKLAWGDHSVGKLQGRPSLQPPEPEACNQRSDLLFKALFFSQLGSEEWCWLFLKAFGVRHTH